MSNLVAVNDLLGKSKTQLMAAIPQASGLTPDRLIRVALTEFRKNPYLQNCDPVSFCGAVMQAAQLGLEFGELKQCALIPYKNECKLMIQYQGYLALLWRSKAVTNVQAKVVYEGDDFFVSFGSENRLHHVPHFKSTVPTHFYAGATPVGGSFMFEVMSLAQVEDHKNRYARGIDKRDSPWNTSFESMALKTVIRKMIKLLPLSADNPIHAAVAAENQEYIDVQPDKIVAMQDQGAQEQDIVAEHDVAVKGFMDAYLKAKEAKAKIDDVLPDPDKFLSEAPTAKVRAMTSVLMERMKK
jgi:recombination protein RecT